MRTLLLLTALTLAYTGFAQESDERTGSYIFFKAPPGEVSSQMRSDGLSNLPVPLGAKIVYLYEDSQKVYYSYWPWKKKSPLQKTYVDFSIDTLAYKNAYPGTPVPSTIAGKYFSMDIEEFEDITNPLYRRFKGFSAGAYTVPFRLRSSGDNFDFESALSLQANFIAGFGSQKSKSSWLDVSFGIGLTGVKLNEDNSAVEEARTANAFTVSFGGVIKPERFINAGVFWGWDFLGSSDRNVRWQYNRKPWLGLGINLSFNEVTTDKQPDDAPKSGS